MADVLTLIQKERRKLQDLEAIAFAATERVTAQKKFLESLGGALTAELPPVVKRGRKRRGAPVASGAPVVEVPLPIADVGGTAAAGA